MYLHSQFHKPRPIRTQIMTNLINMVQRSKMKLDTE